MLANWWREAPLAIKGKYNQMVSYEGNVGLSLNQVKQDNTNICLMGEKRLHYAGPPFKTEHDSINYRLLTNRSVRPPGGTTEKKKKQTAFLYP